MSRPYVVVLDHGSGNPRATRFHPEKSSDAGAAPLRNWLAGLRC